MDFAVLGPVEARLDGKPVALGGVKPRALLAILLLARNQVVSRDRLIDGLWGERPPASAAHSLDHYVSRLRTTLGPDRVLRRSPGYVLRVEPGELDVDCFDDLRRRGREELAAGRHAAAAATLSAALALWRGTALADVLYTPFAGEEAERLEERRLLAIEDRVEADLALGQARELVPELEALVAQHPYRERLVGQLMLALDRGGRKAEALEVYRSARQRLATELGLEPGHALRELERAILADEIALAPRAPRGAPPIRRRTAVALVVGLLVAGVAASLAFAPHGTQSLVDRGDRIVALASSGGRLERTVSLPGGPSAVAADGSSVWVAEPGQNALLHVDASSGTVVDRIPLASQPGEVVLAGGGVWVASSFGGSVARIDRESGEITRTLELGGPTAIAVGDGGVFVAEAADRRLLELDPVHGNITRRVSLPFAATALAIAGGTAWVANYDTATLAQVELASGRAVASVHVGQGPVAVAAGPDGVWVANSLDGTISRIDPATDAVSATIAVGDGPADVELARGSVWVPDTYSGTVAPAPARSRRRSASAAARRPWPHAAHDLGCRRLARTDAPRRDPADGDHQRLRLGRPGALQRDRADPVLEPRVRHARDVRALSRPGRPPARSRSRARSAVAGRRRHDIRVPPAPGDPLRGRPHRPRAGLPARDRAGLPRRLTRHPALHRPDRCARLRRPPGALRSRARNRDR